MRLATFNILHGRSLSDGRVNPDRLADAVRRLDADVVALQEVDLDQPRSGRTDLTAVAAVAMGAVSHRFVAAVSGTPGVAWTAVAEDEPPVTGYGIALLSRYPVRSWRSLRLPAAALRLPIPTSGPARWLTVGEEPRVAVIAELDTPLGPLTVANTHLSFVPGRNRDQLREVVAGLRGGVGPHLLLGDLNMGRRSAERWSGMRSLAVADTYPAPRAFRQLDHVLTDDPSIVGVRADAVQLTLSDHRALWVDVGRR